MSSTGTDYIELKRTFREISDTCIEDYDFDYQDLLGRDGRLAWSDLLEKSVVVILAEAGAGKTTEVREIALRLRRESKVAFFLRLEDVCANYDSAFEVGTQTELDDWLEKPTRGWVFLDSVDEARLKDPRDFERAIKKLAGKLNAVLGYVSIIITSRHSAWRSKTDLNLVRQYFGASLQRVAMVPLPIEDSSDQDISVGSYTANSEKQGVTVVALKNLTKEQIACFLKSRGVNDFQDFLDALDRTESWPFASRPQDLEELICMWTQKGRFGTRSEMIKHSIARRLRERDQNRAEIEPLVEKDALRAVMCLAAATTLGKNQNIGTPDGAYAGHGLSIQEILPDFDQKQQRLLLSRPIFDEEIYGSVRFHHRTVREYLTALWIKELLDRSASSRNIEDLFFKRQYDQDIVVPTLRAILPWLILKDQRMLTRVQNLAPEILLEGGDPVQLPREIRSEILRNLCKKMATMATNDIQRDYAAVQRFASKDLTEIIRELLGIYSTDNEVKPFLVRMVWIGRLSEALPEVRRIAEDSSEKVYTRSVAIRAVNAIASEAVKDEVKKSFLRESNKLNRELLSELLKGVSLTIEAVEWLIACLEKCPAKPLYQVDHLSTTLEELISRADIDSLPSLVAGCSRLLNIPPLINAPYCKISARYHWIIVPAMKCVKRLILERNSNALTFDALSVLHAGSGLCPHESGEWAELKQELAQIVPEWTELNRALFWHQIRTRRNQIEKQAGERLTYYRRASIGREFWRFEANDFGYILEQISKYATSDDSLVALSLAFDIYRQEHSPVNLRSQLELSVSVSPELTEELRRLLKPPVKSPTIRKLEKQHKEFEKQVKQQRLAERKNHDEWIEHINANLLHFNTVPSTEPAKLRALQYLYNILQNGNISSGQWSDYRWEGLHQTQGASIAKFYHDGVVALWRECKPKLRSEGASMNGALLVTILGLAGLQIESEEILDWPLNLSASEIDHACRHAAFELNGFPSWFGGLFKKYPGQVGKFILQEIRFELSLKKDEKATTYMLYDICWSGQWSWDLIAPEILDMLQVEPMSLSNLEHMLHIVQGSNQPDQVIANLAARKCRRLRNPEHLARWFAVWVGVEPDPAITNLEDHIRVIADIEYRVRFSMIFITNLIGDRFEEGSMARHAYQSPDHLKRLYLLMHTYIRVEHDLNRLDSGIYSPALRDAAQEARDKLLRVLNQRSGKEAYHALIEISKKHPQTAARSWIMSLARNKAMQDGDFEKWTETQVREFHQNYERTPTSQKQLSELAISRLLDLKDELERADDSTAETLRRCELETELRNNIGNYLKLQAQGRYTIVQEEELADGKKPDLKFRGTATTATVPVEIKIAERWSERKLRERMEGQLLNDYMRSSEYGVYLLFRFGDRIQPSKGKWHGSASEFEKLIQSLQSRWWKISPRSPNIQAITVIGIDLTIRANRKFVK